MRRRSGVTLLEVLVAIFVMAIGLLALLVLFPLGALSMASAIQADKTSQCGFNAMAIGEMKSIAQDGNINAGTGLYKPFDPFQNPYAAAVTLLNNSDPNGPSYPVIVDPIGVAATGAAGQVGGAGSCMARRTVTFVDTPLGGQTTTAAAYQWFTDLNDIDWENASPGSGVNGSMPGTPRLFIPQVGATPAQFTRTIGYSWSFVLQRPRSSDATIADTQIIVYRNRSVSLTGALTLPEYLYNTVYVDTNKNTFSIDYTASNQTLPPLRVGDWVFDNTPITTTVGGVTYGSAHGYFYRVVGINTVYNVALTNNPLIEIEVEQPIRGSLFPGAAPAFVGAPQDANGNTLARLIVLDGVAQVYAKGVTR
jgi:prepilin-type N-terminal cleavage/methylation domain-containing protein